MLIQQVWDETSSVAAPSEIDDQPNTFGSASRTPAGHNATDSRSSIGRGSGSSVKIKTSFPYRGQTQAHCISKLLLIESYKACY